MAANAIATPDDFGDYDDWVELYNPFTVPVDVSGYYISDDPLNQNQISIASFNRVSYTRKWVLTVVG